MLVSETLTVLFSNHHHAVLAGVLLPSAQQVPPLLVFFTSSILNFPNRTEASLRFAVFYEIPARLQRVPCSIISLGTLKEITSFEQLLFLSFEELSSFEDKYEYLSV